LEWKVFHKPTMTSRVLDEFEVPTDAM
jgi:hypothetical protein